LLQQVCVYDQVLLAAAKTFFRWCVVEKKWLARNALEVVKGIGKGPADSLFGRDWPREWVQRICKAAKVPVVTAHGMRGLHGTLAVERGATTHVVAQALGHESETTSRESYISREAITGADQRRVLTVLAGGRSSSGNETKNSLPRSLVSEKTEAILWR